MFEKMIILFLLFASVLGSQVVFELDEHIDPEQFAEHNGLTLEKHLFNRFYLFAADSPQRTRNLLARRDVEGVRWGEEQVAVKRYKRNVVPPAPQARGGQGSRLRDDPLYPQQWHLKSGGSVASVDEDGVEPPSGGAGGGFNILIGIVDDGLQHSHPELAAQYVANHSWNFNNGNKHADPTPRDPRDGHGTAAAAVAVGSKLNGHCGRGVAWNARVAGLRLIAEPATGATEAEALSYHSDHIRIYSNSWGPADTGRGMDAPSRVVREALAYFATQKNRIYVWASGNGRDNLDSCAYDGYAGNPYVNAIGAVDYDGQQSWYSEGCANLMAVAPSSGVRGRGITTADLMGPAGYEPGECTADFGGTSSAAPLASGIIALLLERRPDLTWRDVKHVIALGATQINPEDPSWHVNGRGYYHSNAYGFGLLKIPKLLGVLANYTGLVASRAGGARSDNLPPQRQVLSPVIRPTRPDANTFTVNLTHTNITFIEQAILRIRLRHPRRGDVAVWLVSPEGTVSVLAEWRNDPNPDYPSAEEGWSFCSLHHWGEAQADGVWEVQVQDKTSPSRVRVEWFMVGVFGF